MLQETFRDRWRFSMLGLLACAVLGAPAVLHAQKPARGAGQDAAEKTAAGKNLTEGKQTFVTICAACHGLDGGGGERGPDISHRREIQRLTDKALFKIVREGVPGTGMPAFGSLGEAGVQAVVLYLRSLQGQTATALPGDPKQGKVLFFGKAGCSQCHMAHGGGGFIGSDLSSYASTQLIDEIRSAITAPNKNLDPRKRTVTITTPNGQTLTGVVRNEDNFSLSLQATDGTLHLLAKPELQSVEYQPRSLMPDDYGTKLSRQELDDLVSYLVSMARNKTQMVSEQE